MNVGRIRLASRVCLVGVTAGEQDAESPVSNADSHLLGELADRVGFTAGSFAATPRPGERGFGHDRGRLLSQLAAMLAAGGRCVRDMATPRDQPDVFSAVATPTTTSRTFDAIGGRALGALPTARATAQAKAWDACDSRLVPAVTRPGADRPRDLLLPSNAEGSIPFHLERKTRWSFVPTGRKSAEAKGLGLPVSARTTDFASSPLDSRLESALQKRGVSRPRSNRCRKVMGTSRHFGTQRPGGTATPVAGTARC
jgi:hypothetical protein